MISNLVLVSSTLWVYCIVLSGLPGGAAHTYVVFSLPSLMKIACGLPELSHAELSCLSPSLATSQISGLGDTLTSHPHPPTPSCSEEQLRESRKTLKKAWLHSPQLLDGLDSFHPATCPAKPPSQLH